MSEKDGKRDDFGTLADLGLSPDSGKKASKRGLDHMAVHTPTAEPPPAPNDLLDRVSLTRAVRRPR